MIPLIFCEFWGTRAISRTTSLIFIFWHWVFDEETRKGVLLRNSQDTLKIINPIFNYIAANLAFKNYPNKGCGVDYGSVDGHPVAANGKINPPARRRIREHFHLAQVLLHNCGHMRLT